MDNCGGGQRLPPDGDEFPAAYQEFTNPNQQYQFVTRDSVTSYGDLDDRDEPPTFVNSEKTILAAKNLPMAETRVLTQCVHDNSMELKSSSPGDRTSVSYTHVSNRKTIIPNLVSEKKIEISGYYPKEVPSTEVESLENPPPLPLTGPPKIDPSLSVSSHSRNPPSEPIQPRKFSMNGELWRQDDKSERSVRDKIAMFSSQSSLEAPLFPTVAATVVATTNGVRRLSKYKSSDDVFSDEKSSNSSLAERTQSSFDLTSPGSNNSSQDLIISSSQYSHQKAPSLPQSSPPLSPGAHDFHGKFSSSPNSPQKTLENRFPSMASTKPCTPLGSYSPVGNVSHSIRYMHKSNKLKL